MSRRRRNETDEQRARRELISDFLTAANIRSMDDIQELFKEALAGFMEEKGVISAGAAAKKAVMNPYIFVDMGEDSISLEWEKVDGAEEYAIVGMVNNRWKILDQVKDNSTKYSLNSYLLENLKAGKKYTVAVAAKFNGKWNTDLSNALRFMKKHLTILFFDSPEKIIFQSCESILKFV